MNQQALHEQEAQKELQVIHQIEANLDGKASDLDRDRNTGTKSGPLKDQMKQYLR